MPIIEHLTTSQDSEPRTEPVNKAYSPQNTKVRAFGNNIAQPIFTASLSPEATAINNVRPEVDHNGEKSEDTMLMDLPLP